MRIYLVGGALRDELMGRPAHDRDYVVLGAGADEFARRFPGAHPVGRQGLTYIVAGHEYTLSPETSIQQDLARRDLTVNAIARDEQGALHAHPLALADLQARLLRPVHVDNFRRDPLRVLRAARFAAQLPDFACHPELIAAMSHIAAEGALAGLAAERVGDEVRKACAASQPARFFRLLAECDGLAPWLAEVEAGRRIPAGPAPYHTQTLFDHLLTVMTHLAGDPLRVWMGLCHDLGKTATDPQRWPRHHGHEALGAELALLLGQRLRLPNALIRAGAAAARWHMLAGRYDSLRPGTRVRLLLALKRDRLLAPLFALAAADAGRDFQLRAEQEMAAILAVRLPPERAGHGPEAGMRLHMLRCQALRQRDRACRDRFRACVRIGKSAPALRGPPVADRGKS
jgi:tRNA nucleotidyltransferase (CCA-adding enzyme)